MTRLYLKTFGCRVNQSETERIADSLCAGGAVRPVERFEDADLCVVNTCSVTNEADKDALQLLRRIARRNPASRLVVTGCLATHSPDAVRAAAPAALVVSNDGKQGIPALVGCPGAEAGVPRSLLGRSRALVKVADGCRMRCAYCVVPSVRPAVSSKPYHLLQREVRGLLERGGAELVLCGVRLGRYRDGDLDFVGMLGRLAGLPGRFRIRLSSLEVTDVTERFLRLLDRAGDRICPSFHLPLQSGSAAVLKRMRRWYTLGRFSRAVEALRARRPGAGLFTDVMAGFPGETEAQAEETVRFIRDIGFSGLHVFRYSRREGTEAARMGGHLPGKVLQARARRLRALDLRLRSSFAASAVGSVREFVSVPKKGPEGMTDHFLTVSLDREPGRGIHRAEILSCDGPFAHAKVIS